MLRLGLNIPLTHSISFDNATGEFGRRGTLDIEQYSTRAALTSFVDLSDGCCSHLDVSPDEFTVDLVGLQIVTMQNYKVVHC